MPVVVRISPHNAVRVPLDLTNYPTYVNITTDYPIFSWERWRADCAKSRSRTLRKTEIAAVGKLDQKANVPTLLLRKIGIWSNDVLRRSSFVSTYDQRCLNNVKPNGP